MSSAARTNLTSQRVNVSGNELGQGSFRVAYEGEYVGGNRNQQACACKQFKACFASMEDEFFQDDFRVADKAVQYAEEWNQFCEPAKEIMITVGDVHVVHGDKFLVEPLIREYRKFTSNSGWIEDSNEHAVLAMEAFSHFTYHRSGGNLLVCDLQGRLKKAHEKPLRVDGRGDMLAAAAVRPDRPRGERHRLVFQQPRVQPVLSCRWQAMAAAVGPRAVVRALQRHLNVLIEYVRQAHAAKQGNVQIRS